MALAKKENRKYEVCFGKCFSKQFLQMFYDVL